jgi:2-amino-4-hydroxy-6-hydroxymethyldihydropteridine diphosphokinase
MEKTVSYIGLGSNLNDPVYQVLSARKEIIGLPGTEELAFSDLYASAPMGPQDQPDFINAVLVVETALTPLALLYKLQTIENEHGRIRGNQRWGSRTLDLDILLYGQLRLSTPELTIPHYGIAERGFVLYPLSECTPELDIPGYGKLSDLLEKCPSTGLRKIS